MLKWWYFMYKVKFNKLPKEHLATIKFYLKQKEQIESFLLKKANIQ